MEKQLVELLLCSWDLCVVRPFSVCLRPSVRQYPWSPASLCGTRRRPTSTDPCRRATRAARATRPRWSRRWRCYARRRARRPQTRCPPWASHRLPPRSWYSWSAWTRSSASPPPAWWSDPRAHAEAAAVNSVETPSVQFFTLLAHTSTHSIRRSGWRVSVNVKGEKAGCLRSIRRSKSGRSTTIFRDEL